MVGNNGTLPNIIAEIITVAFIVLKIFGFISWGWVWVLSPLWIRFGLLAIEFFINGLRGK